MDMTKIDMLIASRDPAQRRAAATRLADGAGEGVFDRLEGLLRDRNSGVRAAAQNTIQMLASRTAVEQMIPLLAEDDAGMRNTAIEILRNIGDEGLDLLHGLTRSADDNLRLFAVDILGSIGNPDSLDDLLECLGDTCPNIRCAAIVSLGRIGHPAAFEPLTRLIDDEEWIRFAVVEALAGIPHAGTIDFLLGELPRRTADEITTCAILDTLGKVGSPRVVAPLIDLLAGMGAYVRLSVVQAIMAILPADEIAGLDPASRTALKAVLEQNLLDADEDAMPAMLGLLARIGDKTSIECIVSLALVTGPDVHDERWGAIRTALASLGDTASLVALLDHPDEKLQVMAAEVLGSTGNREAALAITQRVFQVAGYVRRAFTASLARIAGMENRAVLRRLMHDSDGHVASLAIRGLGALGDAADIEAIEPFLDHHYDDVAQAALEALAGLGTAQAEEIFVRLLEQSKPRERIMGLEGLARSGSDLLAPAVMDRVKDPDWEVRLSAVRVAKERQVALARDTLLALLNDENDEIRYLAVDIAGQIRAAELRPFLEDAVEGGDLWLAYHAIEALGQYHDPAVRQRLLGILGKGADLRRIAAARALGTWGDPGLVDELEVYLDDENLDVARAVAQALDALQGEGIRYER